MSTQSSRSTAKAAKPFTPQIATASDLLDGSVVFLGAADWLPHPQAAEVAADAEAAARLLARAAGQPERVVGAYLVDVAVTEAGPAPLHHRERIRALGPTTRPDLGKQAER